MTDKDTEFLQRLLVTFKVEADEHLKGISSGLLELEKCEAPERQQTLIEIIFREAHSLKGAARAVNLVEIETLCQALESVFSDLKKQILSASVELFDLFQEVLALLERLLADAGTERTHEEKAMQRQLVMRLELAVKKGHTAAGAEESDGEKVEKKEENSFPPITDPPIETPLPPPLVSSPPPPAPPAKAVLPPQLPETVRVSTARLTSVLLQSEEMLSARLAASQRALDMRSVAATFTSWKKEWSRVRPLFPGLRATGLRGRGSSGEQQRALDRVLDFLDWNSEFLKSLESRFTAEVKAAERDSRVLGSMVNNLLNDMKKVLMFPFSSLLEILPRIVRDLARENGKKIELSISGDEIEIDRRILEEMKDPLIHLVRNCVDHGIESPAERKAKGKTPSGTIKIAIIPRDDKVELTIADDGAGVALDRVRSALLKGSILPGEKVAELGDFELLAQIFQSGVTTSPIITELSGRGLGLAIVREKVERLGGTVTVVSQPDSGTTFRILLPLTVATFRGLLVRIGEQLFVLPGMHVSRVLRVKPEEIKTVENRETISLNGEALSLSRLATVLQLATPADSAKSAALLPLVILSSADTRIAFLVDEIVGEQEVLLKGLGRQLSRVRNVAGATVLGNGRVAPILNVADLMKSAIKFASSRRESAGLAVETAAPIRSALVVEDSITTRTLLKNILETAGYAVVTAVDGLDALTSLRSTPIDIVVSDIEMPRMNGFELTAKIRSDKTLSGLPVILVTALASREDRERGIDAGANAYIVKSSFDQSNLLAVMKKLI